MDIAQVSTQFFSAAMPAALVGAGVVGVLLLASGLVLRWRRFIKMVQRVFLRRPTYDHRKIFSEYLERFNSITDRRELYPAILGTTCRVIGAHGASLLIRDTKDNFQMKASYGLKPFGFQVSQVLPFLNWLEKERAIVTRSDLVHSKIGSVVKNEGICYFVQLGAEACVPLFIGDRLYGVINLGERGGLGYDKETKDVLKLLSVWFATAIHNANLYQALIRQNLSLKEASGLKNQLLSNLSHELRTPLSGIIGLAELLAEGSDGPLNDEQLKHLKIIQHSGRRLLDTVTAMLDISKLEVNKLDLNVQKLNITRIVSQVAHEVTPNDRTKLEIKMNEETPGVYGDEKRLRQVFKHLLDNAAKFTKQGTISVDATKCGEMLKVSVKDTGVGIAKDKQKTIFEGFRQADGSITRAYDGLGLGLAISKKLVELHGGRLMLHSKEGFGSEFSFTLPLKPIGVFGKDAPASRAA